MDTRLKEILSFLNIRPEQLDKVSEKTILQMAMAIDNDDYMKLHQLGYEVKNYGKNN